MEETEKQDQDNIEVKEIKIEGYEQNKYSDEIAVVINKEIEYITSIYNQKVMEIKSTEETMNRLKTEIREIKSKLEKKKLAKSVLLNEPIIRSSPKIIKPKEEKITYTDWKQKKKEVKEKKKKSGDMILNIEDDWKKEPLLDNLKDEKEVE